MKKAKKIFRYAVMFAAGIALLWYIYRGHGDELLQDLSQAKYGYVLISILLGVIGLIARTYRWNMLLEPLGYTHLSRVRTFLAVMSGYFMNIFVPRAGELTRCAVLKRTSGVNFSSALATVVVERVFDLIILILILAVALVLQSDEIAQLMQQTFAKQKLPGTGFIYTLLIGLLVLALLGVFVLLKWRHALRRYAWYRKFTEFMREFAKGLVTLRHVKSVPAFLLTTLIIWVTYYYMAVIIFYALPATSGLGVEAGLGVLIAGGLGMSAPVQGGIGAYHFFVSRALMLHGIEEPEALSFAALVHSSQLLFFLIFGGIAFVIAFFIPVRPAATTTTPSAT